MVFISTYKVYELPKNKQFFDLSILVMINRKKQMITANQHLLSETTF